MKTIRIKDAYCFKVKRGKKYIWPSVYKEEYYAKRDIPMIIREIEEERPSYRGKVCVFQLALVRNR